MAAERLGRLLEEIDPKDGRDTLVWAHGFLAAMVTRLEMRAELVDETTLRQQSSEEFRQIQNSLDREKRPGGPARGKRDTLEELERELIRRIRAASDPEEGDDVADAPVPVRRKPGPKGKSGGVALPFSDGSDLPM